MTSTTALMSMAEYLRTSFHPDVDYVDGETEERNLGEYDHGKLQGLLFQIFSVNGESWHTDPVIEQRIRVSGSRVRICDVAVLRIDAPREPVTETAPLLCIEVLSREDRIPRAELVLEDYFAMGVRNIWLIDPMRRTAYTFDGEGLHRADPTNLTVAGTPIKVDLTKAFAALD